MKIDVEFMESMYPIAFKENPIPKLETHLLPSSEFKEKYLDSGAEIVYPTDEEWKEAEANYPEEIGDDFKRLYKGFDNVMNKYSCASKEASNLVILVGHGSMLKCVSDYIQPR